MPGKARWVLASVLGFGILGNGVASAEPLWVKKAKDLGYPATNCQYCHTTKGPKKDSFKPEELNKRGRWLLAEKEMRKASDVDLSWLTDYPGGKEQR